MITTNQVIRSSRGARSRRGVAAVEFVATFPLMAGVLLATLEFGNYFAQLAMVTSGTYEAARAGSFESSMARAIISSEDAAETILNELGFDCASNCGIIAQRDSDIGGTLESFSVEVRVPYNQLTGIVPGGGGIVSAMGFDAPNFLNARATMPVAGPPAIQP
jgi:hypothetical protein